MTVRLLLTCLADAFFGEAGIATVRVLEHAGCTVLFDEEQTCCGQPAFNMGDWPVARTVAARTLKVVGHEVPVVVPSTSCASMLGHGNPLLGLPVPRAFELTSFLVDQLGVRSWPLRSGGPSLKRTVVLHRSCHGRMLGTGGDPALMLLQSIPGMTVVEPEDPDQCCGFGGSFSATHPHLSESIGLEKLRNLAAAGTVVTAQDAGCLLHLRTLAERAGIPLRFAHVAEILAEALP